MNIWIKQPTKTKDDFGTQGKKNKNLDLQLSVCSTNAHPGYVWWQTSRKLRHKPTHAPLVLMPSELSNQGFVTDFKRDPFPRTQHFLKWLVLIEVNQSQVFQNLLNIACSPPYTGVSRSTRGERNFPHRLDPCFPFCPFHLFSYPLRSLATVWSGKYHTSMDGTWRNVTVFLKTVLLGFSF